METSLAVANAIIERANADYHPPTQMKLQKLIYFAHGWSLALYEKPLVEEQFQAWPYGPVLPSVYHEFKSFGMLGIDKLATVMVPLANGGLGWALPPIQNAAFAQPLINRIWEVFGQYSGGQLSDMTHASGSPWQVMFHSSGGARNIPIPNELIQKYFKAQMNYGAAG